MRRNRVLLTNGTAARMARYLQGRRALGRSLYASTPLPFLRRLAMVPDEAEAPDRFAGDGREAENQHKREK